VDEPDAATELVFSYGTLQLESVQLATFGRRLAGTADELPGFAQSMMKIDDLEVVALRNADKYEVAAYKRIAVALRSGLRAWVYVDTRYAPPS
jgi:hypothetical protein